MRSKYSKAFFLVGWKLGSFHWGELRGVHAKYGGGNPTGGFSPTAIHSRPYRGQ